MPQVNADRNLLIGILALQMDFIDRNELIAAMHTWITYKARSLDQILREQEAIDDDTCTLLVALVDKHLEKHDGNAEHSLASVSSLGSAKEVLEQLEDESLRASLVHVSQQSQLEDPNDTNTYVSTGEFTSKGQRFRILRSHAAGGLGKVSVAKDEELDREVALKEIKGKYADDPASRSRFMLEAEVTGGLEHPGIVPVYGLGTYADGRPFYAMRFIRGDSLERAIERFYKQEKDAGNSSQRRLELRKLLGRLIDVCYAIEYAHDRGILHRDLKPGNIMLGKYGETLVVDWGLAKTADQAELSTQEEPLLRPASARDSEATLEGCQLGTPAYMSPEQAAGRLDRLSPASDVYCLGATLYELLTGQVSVSPAKAPDWADRVQKGDFSKPSAIRDDVPRALEAICLRAMSCKQEERYQSAAAFAEDLEKWLADEPVAAWREPIGVRTRRWLRKHQTIATSVAAAIIVGFVVASTAAIVISGQNTALTQAYDDLAKQKTALAEARDDLKLAFNKQEEYLGLARNAVDEMLTQVGRNELKNVPQMEDVRKKLLTKARDFYEEFSDETSEDPRLRMQVALAWRRIADVDKIERDVKQAEAGYRRSIEQLESLIQEDKDQPLYQRELALSYKGLGLLFSDNLDEAVTNFDTAIEIAKPLLRLPDSSPVRKQEFANFHYNRGISFNEMGRQDDAVKNYDTAISILRPLSESDDSDVDAIGCLHELGRCYNNKARALAPDASSRGTLKDVRALYQKAIEHGNKSLELRPGDRDVMFNIGQWNNSLANTLGELGEQSKKEGDTERAQELLESAQKHNARAVELLEELSAPLPHFGNELANSRNSYGALLMRDGKLDLAKRQLDRASETFRRLSRLHGDSQYKDRLSMVRYQLGFIALERNRFEEAERLFEEAVEQGLLALEVKPNESDYIEHLGNAYKGLSMTALRLRRHDDVASYAHKLIASSPEKAAAFYFAAQMFGRSVEIVSEDKTIDKLTSNQLTNNYSEEAISLLKTTLELQSNVDVQPTITVETLEKETGADRAFYYLRERQDFLELQHSLAQ
jgi:eukaryotic-like serine/threonine-protein kinase